MFISGRGRDVRPGPHSVIALRPCNADWRRQDRASSRQTPTAEPNRSTESNTNSTCGKATCLKPVPPGSVGDSDCLG